MRGYELWIQNYEFGTAVVESIILFVVFFVQSGVHEEHDENSAKDTKRNTI